MQENNGNLIGMIYLSAIMNIQINKNQSDKIYVYKGDTINIILKRFQLKHSLT